MQVTLSTLILSVLASLFGGYLIHKIKVSRPTADEVDLLVRDGIKVLQRLSTLLAPDPAAALAAANKAASDAAKLKGLTDALAKVTALTSSSTPPAT